MKAETIEECFPFKDTPTVTWININGIHQVEIIEKIGKHLDLHPLIMEKLGGRLEELEDILVVDPGPETLQEIYRLKKEMIFFTPFLMALQELLNGLERADSPLICKKEVK